MKKDVELAHQIVKALLLLSRQSHPQAFKSFLMGGILTNVIANLPEKYFSEFIQTQPCGQPNCDCHKLAEAWSPLFKAMRKDHAAHHPGQN